MKLKQIVLALVIVADILFPQSQTGNGKYCGEMERNKNVGDYAAYGFVEINNFDFFPFWADGTLGYYPYYDIVPYGTLYNGKTILYSSGFMLSGKCQDTLWAEGVFASGRIYDFMPGKFNAPDSMGTIYTIKREDEPFGESWQNWASAVEQGARFYDGDGDGVYNPVDLNGNGVWDENEDAPLLLGDITSWFVTNDAVPSEARRFPASAPMGIEIAYTLFAVKSENNENLADVIFIKYDITNTGAVSENYDSVYFGIFSDPDLGEYTDDLVGTDTTIQSIFAYNEGEDDIFGENPPAFFIRFLQGPQVYIPGETFTDVNGNGFYDEGVDVPLDSAISMEGTIYGKKIYRGAKNLRLTSAAFMNRSPAFRPPDFKEEAKMFLLGGRDAFGGRIDPCNFPYGNVPENCQCVNEKYIFSGDPVTLTGWLNTFAQDEYLVGSFGPFNLRAGETKEIIIAFVAGQGENEIYSIIEGRQNAQYAQEVYWDNFEGLITSSEFADADNPDKFELYQNYPNPFNPTTTIKYGIPSVIASERSERGNLLNDVVVRLSIYNILGEEVATLVNKRQAPGEYSVQFDASNLPSGVYFYTLRVGGLNQTKKMILMK